MNGLRLACNLYGKTYSDIANSIGINRANISIWLKTGVIPEKRISQLKKMFPEFTYEDFFKELSEDEIIAIKKSHICRLVNEYGINRH
ncbi:hypothetical protein PC41400_14655 [Paenibacillus chitinolyticus]|uniref:XRE family transcriptional regulator n=1 Tax=Paenibacillus chitinolyticus TaxID=79263 RepID=A0A410WWY5_9BACL|nr:hypothetical protein [Paenibacillus chitinolyticus]MCY9593988.1 hypothetical protein [Paenibacillus chitinolyticus]MCY9599643.1 hypothetical protein [Paenibacillus chitinolyticus]QAV18850.1 hypothetical protein PC41400_14655 [Paenibacillus chitinolyticus]